MFLIGARGQQQADRHYRIFGAITSATASQLVTPIPISRSFLFIQNVSNSNLYFSFGSATAIAAITNGAVSSITIVNGGFGFLAPPIVEFMGGAGFIPLTGSGPSGAGLPGYASPNNFPNNPGYRPAQAHTVLTAGVVTSVVIDDPGLGYVFPPWVDIRNADNDRYGCADPFYAGVPNGFLLGPGMSYTEGATTCMTEQIGVYGATVGAAWHMAWMA
jgi:hypothetical protein